MLHDVFISHSMGEDRGMAEEVRQVLEESGIRCWLAERDLLKSQCFPAALRTALEDSHLLLLLFTAGCNDSPWVERELHHAVERRLPILPVLVHPGPSKGIRFLVGTHNWFEVPDGDLRAVYPDLVRSVFEILARPDPYEDLAAVPSRVENLAQGQLGLAVRYLGYNYAEGERGALDWITRCGASRDSRERISYQFTLTDRDGVRIFHVDEALIGQVLDEAIRHDCLRRPEGRFLAASEQVGRRTLWLYRWIEHREWYVFVEAHWFISDFD